MKWVPFILVLLLGSCAKKDKIPAGVLGPEKMERVMTDVLLAESFAEGYLVMDTTRTRDQIFSKELNKVLAIQKLSEGEFRRSWNFYKSRPDLFKVIVDSAYNSAQRNREYIYDDSKKKRMIME